MIYIIGKDVFSEKEKIGEIRKFCCGIDFRPEKEITDGLFSIMGDGLNKTTDPRVLKSIQAIMSIKIPKKYFHWNFNVKLLGNKENLAAYEKRLNGQFQKSNP